MAESAIPPRLPTGALAFVWRNVVRRRWAYASLFALIVSAACCAIAVQYAVRLLVDAMVAAGAARETAAVWTPLGLFLGLVAVESAGWRLAGWFGGRTIVASGVDIRLDLFQHLSGHAMRYFADQLAGSLGGRITQTATSYVTVMTSFAWAILQPCTDFLAALFVFAMVDLRMAGALALFVAIVVACLAVVGWRSQAVHMGYAERASVAGGELIDTVSNMWAVKAFSAQSRERRRLAEHFAHEAGAHVQSWRHLERSRVLHDLALWVMAGIMLFWVINLWRAGEVTAGEVVMVSALTFRILYSSRDLAFALVATVQQLALIGESLRVIGAPHAVADRPGARPFVSRGGGIEFDDVSFSHPGGRKVFEHFSLHIPAGQKIGLVGPSGAGKSTLVALVQRLDDVQQGRVLIDGQPLTHVTQDSLREAIAVVPQEISLFHRSILENIRYGRPEASDEEVYAAARMAYCDDFIRKLPEGYATLVGERGIKLSGGQRQRLGLARAILRDAPIVILDEATSALDSESEVVIQRALATLMGGRTVVAIAHRLSTLATLDRIIVLDEGRVVEDGTPAALRRRDGMFASLWRMQAESLNEDVNAA
jgi:ATP-binding cassette subfamily B protein